MSRRRAGRVRLGADDGATSVVFAVVALLLFAVAALAVDVGNLYAQNQAVQNTADAAAFAAAQELPDSCAAGRVALESLGAADNEVQDDGVQNDGDGEAAPTAADSFSNGQVQVRDAGGSVLAECSMQGRSVTVTTPERRVQFAFAGIFDVFPGGEGQQAGVVSASARVEVRNAVIDMLPFYLPGGCRGDSGTGRHYVASTEPPPGCPEEADQEFGVLGSTRDAGLEGAAAALTDDARDGLDQLIGVLPDESGIDGTCNTVVPPGAATDVGGSRGAVTNCVLVQVLDAAATGEALHEGLLGLGGRLVVDPQEPFTPRSDCLPAGGASTWTTLSNAQAWNTAPSCYLAGSASLSDVLDGTAGSLDEAVLADPRFFLLPELYVDERPEPGQYYPVRALWGAFLTDEGTDRQASCDGVAGCNGVELDGTRVRSLQAFVFPLSSLPRFVQEPTNGTAFRDGLPRTLVLVE